MSIPIRDKRVPILAPAQGVNQRKFIANNQTVTEFGAAYTTVKSAQFRLTRQDTIGRRAVIRITLTGKARIRVTGEDGIAYLSNEYSDVHYNLKFMEAING